MTQKKEVKITKAKGRPMLTWVGKKPLRQVTAYPAQLVERFHPLPEPERGAGGEVAGGLLFHGDNKDVLAWLLANGYRGRVNLVYIDPPFDSGADYVRKVTLRGASGVAKLDGEEYTLGEQTQYSDIWANDNYLQFMYERLLLLKELLAADGHIMVQADDKRGHYIKVVLDEVMGPDNYINDVIWRKGREGGGGTDVNPPLPTEYQNIYVYARSRRDRRWNPPRVPYSASTLSHIEKDERGWYYTRGRMGRKPAVWEIKAGVSKKTYVSDDPHDSRESVIARLTAPDAQYVLMGDVWDAADIPNSAVTDYPTEKPEALLDRVIRASSGPGDLVLDCFIGSGTTAAVAQKLGRRWIGCDINKGAIQTTAKRLQSIILEQIEADRKRGKQGKRVDEPGEEAPPPAQLSFAVYRVNDYDLQIQHNEAVELACETVGITRTRNDPFFDGKLGERLAKIVPFEHPLSPPDLEEVKRELAARPDETRDVTLVCYGKEIAADAWLEEWNRLRQRGDVPNKIEVIELRNDPKYGGFFKHEPASARVEIARTGGKITVEVGDFISPTILQRLKQQSGVLSPQIDDWRAMVDSVMIDTAYDGEVFNIVHSDVPKKKADLVAGSYELDAPAGKTTVAVKITDMLGEEVLVTKTV